MGAYTMSVKTCLVKVLSGSMVRNYRGSAYDVGYRKYGGLLEYIQQKHCRDLLPLQFVSHE